MAGRREGKGVHNAHPGRSTKTDARAAVQKTRAMKARSPVSYLAREDQAVMKEELQRGLRADYLLGSPDINILRLLM
jgi:hypothetical protein